ncbi:hypothetical protein EMIT0P74_50294 [Pseudomonas sp. IT-P74]
MARGQTVRLPASNRHSGITHSFHSFTVAGAAPELRAFDQQKDSLTGFPVSLCRPKPQST